MCWSLFCLVVFSVLSSSAIILLGKEKAYCITLIVFLMSDVFRGLCLFLTVPWVGLQFVILALPGLTWSMNYIQALVELG